MVIQAQGQSLRPMRSDGHALDPDTTLLGWRPLTKAGTIRNTNKAKAATAVVPIVVVGWRRSGQARPGDKPQETEGNVTRVTFFAGSQVGAKRVENPRELGFEVQHDRRPAGSDVSGFSLRAT
jgi:hypothetical protein